MGRHLMLVATGAPLASRTADVVRHVVAAGWTVNAVATPSALAWIDAEEFAGTTHQDLYVEYRTPNQPKRGPEPDAVVVCPATFNTINKITYGLADNYAVGVICEAMGRGVPVIVFPMVNDRLWHHPALALSLQTLRKSGVQVRDISNGEPGEQPVPSGTGGAIVTTFDPQWVVDALS